MVVGKKNRKRWKNINYALLYVLDELIAAESESELIKLNDVDHIDIKIHLVFV